MTQTAQRGREVIAWLLVAGLAWLVYRVVQPFLTPLVWASVLTAFFYPLHRRLLARIRRPAATALLSTAAVGMLLLAPFAWMAPAFVSQAGETIANAPRKQIVERVQSAAEALLTRLPGDAGDLDTIVEDAIISVRNRIGQWSAKIAGGIAGFVIDLIVLMLALFYLFRDGPRLLALLRDITPFADERHDRMIRQAMDMISVTITAGVVVALVQGVLGGLAFAVLDLPAPVFWGVITAFLALIPFLGAWMVWLPVAVGLILNGDVSRGVALLAAGILLISAIDNFLRPMIIADRSQLNAVLVFVSVFGGIQAFGLVGLVLGPLLVATAAGLISGYRDSLRASDQSEASQT